MGASGCQSGNSRQRIPLLPAPSVSAVRRTRRPHGATARGQTGGDAFVSRTTPSGLTCSNVQRVAVDNQLKLRTGLMYSTARGLRCAPGPGSWCNPFSPTEDVSVCQRRPRRSCGGRDSRLTLLSERSRAVKATCAQTTMTLLLLVRQNRRNRQCLPEFWPVATKTSRLSSNASIPPYSTTPWIYGYDSRYSIAGAFSEGGIPLLPQSACPGAQTIAIRRTASYAVAGICAHTTSHALSWLHSRFTGERTTHESI